jgi:hypothetical protein
MDHPDALGDAGDADPPDGEAVGVGERDRDRRGFRRSMLGPIGRGNFEGQEDRWPELLSWQRRLLLPANCGPKNAMKLVVFPKHRLMTA